MAFGLMRAFPLGRRRIETRSLSLSIVFGAALLLATLLSLLYLTQASTVATIGYDIKRLEQDEAQLEIRNEQLRFTIAQLQSLDRVEKEAAARLRMGPPAKLLFVNVDLSSSAGSSAGQGSTSTVQRGPRRANSPGWWEGLRSLFRW